MSDFVYHHRISHRAKSLRLTIGSSGQLTVTSPPHLAIHTLNDFVNQHQDWINRHRQQLANRPQLGESADSVYLFGQLFQLRFTHHLTQPPQVICDNQSVTVNSWQANASAPEIWWRWLRQTATKYLVPRTHQLAQIMGLKFGKISLRQQKTRWGSCSRQGNLNFNWRLVHTPTEVIDYVIIHELAHTQHHNHSHQFWQLVSRYDPEHPQHRGWLKRHGYQVG